MDDRQDEIEGPVAGGEDLWPEMHALFREGDFRPVVQLALAVAAELEDGPDGERDIHGKAAELMRLLADRCERALASRAFSRQWYAERFRRLEDLGKQHGVWPEMAAIMANGTASAHETPTYAQQLNLALHKAERLEKANAAEKHRADWLQLRCERLTQTFDDIMSGRAEAGAAMARQVKEQEEEISRLRAEADRQAGRAALWHRSYRHMERERDRVLRRAAHETPRNDAGPGF